MGITYYISIYYLIVLHYYTHIYMLAIIYQLGEHQTLIITSPSFYKRHIVG